MLSAKPASEAVGGLEQERAELRGLVPERARHGRRGRHQEGAHPLLAHRDLDQQRDRDQRHQRRQHGAQERPSSHRASAAALERVEQHPHLARERGVGAQRRRPLGRQRERVIEHDAPRAPRQHDRALGQEGGLDDRVGHEQYGHPPIAPELVELLVELLAGDLVERRERLVEQQQVGLGHQRARERGAHAHAARELRRIAAGGVGETDPLDRLARAVQPLRARDTAELERERHVVEQVAPRQQVRVLEDVGDRRRARSVRAAWPRWTVADDGAAGGPVETRDQP